MRGGSGPQNSPLTPAAHSSPHRRSVNLPCFCVAEPPRTRWGFAHLALERAEAAVAAGVFLRGFEKVGLMEVGPELLEDDHFRVADLPEQEVRHAQLAGGADEQVGVGDVRGVEARGEGGAVEPVSAATRSSCELSGGCSSGVTGAD